ncbi:CIC family chloride channel protein [Roseivirga pacifica]|uniref:Chloride channel protein, CIC family n=1 Tax=Roseivirga pacifica TaxID=1267423 RepID=A0A1I0MQ52_9BACT|nr:chloride channel protein [Roseivirga pacifica]MCO6359121.1 CBS domain-containing protein [Roseivirga pacifica]MCO6365243.1 CBS domain-containing protein [Roseivirga pacifica]MCO6372027.1 CBS domain-containing protein [Roseivirga pacifica]MCO6375862.1 CBS domain-containing protein [Roseivirga pacifica]MCO6379405.1 CBS domain-containing protein [Roseivirga pacifica]
MSFKHLLSKFLVWRIRHLSTKSFVIILGGITGIVGGLAAVTLKSTVHFLQATFEGLNLPWLYIVLPLIGIFITAFLAKNILKEQLGHGVTTILYIISKKSSKISQNKMFSRMITSGITVGFGGSVGLEAPIVVTGSAIGSNIGKLMHLNYKQRTLLIGCGAAAAISGIFNSPVAGVIFSVEVILTDVTVGIFIPLLIASVLGSMVSMLLLGEDVLFSFNLTDPFLASDFPFYIALGILCGLASVYFTRFTLFAEKFIGGVKSVYVRAIVGGLGLGLIILFFNPIYGEGYEFIKLILNGRAHEILLENRWLNEFNDQWVVLVFALLVLLIKPFATGLTIGAGGNGGIFAPSLFVGGLTGFVFATFTNLLNLGKGLSISNFALVGMCGVMSGVMHAPLTAIFLIAEITSGYTLFLPLMLVSAIAFSTSSYFEKYSFYASKLIKSGDLIPYDKDKQVLSMMQITRLIEKDLLTIHPEQKLEDLVAIVKKSSRNIFPVVNEENHLKGIITLDDIREMMFDAESQKNVIVARLMHKPPDIVNSQDKMLEVMSKFEKTGAWNLPVVDNGQYVGIVSKSRIFNAYRIQLKRQNKE